MTLKNHLIAAGLTFATLSATLAQTAETKETPKAEAKAEATWTPIFNGKDLDGWTPKFKGSELGVNLNDTFIVKDGLLTVDYSKWESFKGEFGHLFYKTPYSNYNIRGTYRFIGEQVKGGPKWALRNNGFMLHCQDPKTMKLGQNFPNSIEVQLLGGLGEEDRPNLNICTPGTQIHWQGKLTKEHVVRPQGPTFHGDQWVTVEVQVRGDKFTHIAEGKVVCEYDNIQLDDGTPVKKGYISIQAETAPIQFKSIEIQVLPDEE